MALSKDEIRRRIVAARTLRGMEQTELASLMADDGLGKHDLGKIERGGMTMQATHRRSIAHHLRMSERWFMEDNIDGLLSDPGDDPDLSDLVDILRDHDAFSREAAATHVNSRTETFARILIHLEETTHRMDRLERLVREVHGIAGRVDDQLALRDASRATAGRLAGQLDNDAPAAEAASDTHDAVDATQESSRVRGAGN